MIKDGKRFYVYRIFNMEGHTLYIGKGVGPRLRRQKRRFGADGETIAWFPTESRAYAFEKQLIETHKPPLNKAPGGNGGRCGWARVIPHGFTPRGLEIVAPYLVRFLALSVKYSRLLYVIDAFVQHHGMEKVADAIRPHMYLLRQSEVAAIRLAAQGAG